MAPLPLTKCGGTPCGEAIWAVFVAQGPGARLLRNFSAGGILPPPWLELVNDCVRSGEAGWGCLQMERVRSY